MFKIDVLVEGAEAADRVCLLLSRWGYTSEAREDARGCAITARGLSKLPDEWLNELLSEVMTHGGSLHDFQMAVDS